MSPRQSDARQRVVSAAAEMLARHGLNATSIREMTKRAEAPLAALQRLGRVAARRDVLEHGDLVARRAVGGPYQRHRNLDAAAVRPLLEVVADGLVKNQSVVGSGRSSRG